MMERHHILGEGAMTLVGPLRIGTGEDSLAMGLQVARDASGRPVIPASSLAGVLRHLARELALAGEYGDEKPCLSINPKGMCGDCVVCRLLGSPERPSALYLKMPASLLDCDCGDSAPWSEVRDHVGIGRQSGAAAPARLFNHEVVQKGARFRFRFELRAAADQLITLEALLLDCLEYWKTWGGGIGGSTGSGMGRFSFDYKTRTLDLYKADDLECWLLAEDTSAIPIPNNAPLRQGEAPVRRLYENQEKLARKTEGFPLTERLRWHLRLTPLGPIMVKTEFDEPDDALSIKVVGGDPERVSVDSSFVKTGRLDCRETPTTHYIPGSSLRGAFRSHCERILRTRASQELGEREYLNCQSTVVCDPHEDGHEDVTRRLKACKPEPVRGPCRATKIEEGLCPACRLFGASGMGGRVQVSEAYPDSPDAYQAALELMSHVAIDRFTGGAADQKLFADRPAFPLPGQEASLQMSLSLELECPSPWELALVLFLLRDLERDRIRIGYGKHRGLGKARVEVVGWEAVLREGSPLDKVIGAEGQALGPLRYLQANSLPDSTGLEAWDKQVGGLVQWAMCDEEEGWSPFITAWCQPLCSEQEVPQ